jgi:hypothetical protein
LEVLEKQIEQQEAENKKKAEAEAKRIVDERKAELEKQKLQKEQKQLAEEKRKLEEQKRKLEEARQAEFKRKQQEEEAKQLAIEELERKAEEAKKAIVTLVFYRNQSYPFGGGSALISHDGNEIGKLLSKSYFIYQSPPGKQNFKATIFGDWNAEKGFDFKPSSTNFVMVAIDWTTLNLSIETGGVEAISKLKNSGSIDPKQFFNNFDEIVNQNTESSESKNNIRF